MFVKYLFLCFFGLAGGITVSGGVFTVLIAVGLIPRFAGKTGTAKHVFLYENMVILGTITGSFFSVYEKYGQVGSFFKRTVGVSSLVWSQIGNLSLAVIGTFSGIFVGCLALAIAEMLDTIPIFARRICFKKGLGFAISCIAVGKMVGSLIYFARGFYTTSTVFLF